MPKIVDHEQRKAEITKAVLKSIGKNGLANTTIRGIAREGGYSSGTLAHYFGDKDELINFAFQAVADDSHNRIQKRAATRKKAVDKLRVVIEELTPSSSGIIDSQISMSFWAEVSHDDRLVVKFKEVYQALRGFIRTYIEEGIDNGEFSKSLDVEVEVDLIVAITDGFLVSFLLAPDSFPEKRRIKLITAALSRLTIAA